MVLSLTQKFQEISGTLRVDGRTLPLRDAKISGADISFAVEARDGAMSFAGSLDGRGMRGTMKRGSRESRWSARRR